MFRNHVAPHLAVGV